MRLGSKGHENFLRHFLMFNLPPHDLLKHGIDFSLQFDSQTLNTSSRNGTASNGHSTENLLSELQPVEFQKQFWKAFDISCSNIYDMWWLSLIGLLETNWSNALCWTLFNRNVSLDFFCATKATFIVSNEKVIFVRLLKS